MGAGKQYAVFREPGHVLVGVEGADFNVVRLGEEYGSGDYEVGIFQDGRHVRQVHQVVGGGLGPPRKTDELPESALPSA